jgi:hypothetical protein
LAILNKTTHLWRYLNHPPDVLQILNLSAFKLSKTSDSANFNRFIIEKWL